MAKSAQIPIWFFIGVLLAAYGVIIFVTGVVRWIRPPAAPLIMDWLHPAVWWGLLLTAIGGLYTWRYWPGRRNETGRKKARPKPAPAAAGRPSRSRSRQQPSRRARKG
jgi:hypothetical protein